MRDLLDIEEARKIARALRVIAGFPWGEEPINMIANCLVGWCRGAFCGNCMYTPEEQAGAVVVEAVQAACKNGLKWDELGGVAMLYTVYREHFLDAAKPQQEETSLAERYRSACITCNGTGWEIVERADTSGATRCRHCGGTGRDRGAIDVSAQPVNALPVVCSVCNGKETILAGDERKPCPKCVTAQRQQERRALLESFEAGRSSKAPPSSLPEERRAEIEAQIAVELARQGRPINQPHADRKFS